MGTVQSEGGLVNDGHLTRKDPERMRSDPAEFVQRWEHPMRNGVTTCEDAWWEAAVASILLDRVVWSKDEQRTRIDLRDPMLGRAF